MRSARRISSAELQREFSGVKFSVKSESCAGGDAIRARWEFGPTTDEVAKFTDKYREGDFDGMTDSYDYDHDNVWPDVFGGAKYVTESRCFSEDFYEQVGCALCALQRIAYEGQFTRHLLGKNCDRDLSQYFNELLSRTHFPVGAKFKGVEYTPDAERAGNNWCRIIFDLPSPAKPADTVGHPHRPRRPHLRPRNRPQNNHGVVPHGPSESNRGSETNYDRIIEAYRRQYQEHGDALVEPYHASGLRKEILRPMPLAAAPNATRHSSTESY